MSVHTQSEQSGRYAITGQQLYRLLSIMITFYSSKTDKDGEWDNLVGLAVHPVSGDEHHDGGVTQFRS